MSHNSSLKKTINLKTEFKKIFPQLDQVQISNLSSKIIVVGTPHLYKGGFEFSKWLSVHLWTKWFWVWVPLQSFKLQILHLFRARSSWHSGNYRMWIHSESCMWHDNNIQYCVSQKEPSLVASNQQIWLL